MSQSVYSKDIFYNLPIFPEHDGKKYSAVVTGANGITGAHMIRVLSEAPERWDTIYALSRKAPNAPAPPHVKYLAIDFLDSPEEIAKQMKEQGVGKIDYAFFGSYLQPPPKEGEGLWSDTDETERVNMALLSNFLNALKISDKLPKRFLLQTGGKHYGVHIGPTLTPQEEEDPRYLKEPNFYFPQEDFLWKWCAENGVEWNVTRPGFIIGAVKETAMSIAHGLAVYASIQAELGQPLTFPGDIGAWEAEKHISAALLIAYHAEWTVLTPKAANQALNITDGGLHTYGKFWPILAGLYGIPYGIPEPDESKYQTITMPIAPPPRGFGPAGQIRASGSIEAWSQKPEVQEAWKRLKQKHNLIDKPDPFDKPKDIFGLLDGELLGPWSRSMSMEKSRKLGWNGFIASSDGLIKTFGEMADLKMVPPMAKKLEDVKVSYVGY